MTAARVGRAPAKVNLTLHVLARRPDGYHEIESLVTFASVGDRLSFIPDGSLSLIVLGPEAQACGDVFNNLVLKAARALAERIEGLRLGLFLLSKRLPIAAGLGGGSSDAAAALRLLAHANGLGPGDLRVWEAAKATGADVPVCLDPRARVMRGIGDVLSDPIALRPIPAVLVNPGVTLATKDVFAAFDKAPERAPSCSSAQIQEQQIQEQQERPEWVREGRLILSALAQDANDLETSAIRLCPEIARILEILRQQAGCELARMSGSGATCFGLFASRAAASAAARSLRAAHPHWWVRATTLR
jgi:4-diphosphocytidyl-2-C-methyl-D-erythritol kinase